MFKLKPGNVFQKINGMDRKQAYTWGAVVVVAFIALLSLASYLGGADESSMEGFDAQGYDLAQLPFVNDEAEAYLLSSKYPDMQNNQSSLFYSPEEKEDRQEADAEEEDDREPDINISAGDTDVSSVGRVNERGSSSRRYGRAVPRAGRGGGATAIGQLGTVGGAAKASGSGNSYTWGSNPRGDFRPFSNQDKGSGGMANLQNSDAKKALSQFARGSSAAARLRDNKGANAKRAMMGGNIMGGEAFGDNGVDLSKLGSLALDTNAPVPESVDLSDLSDKVDNAAQKAKEDNDNKEELSFWEKLGQRLLEGMVDKLVEGLGNAMSKGMDSLFSIGSKNSASRNYGNSYLDSMSGMTKKNCGTMCDSVAGMFSGNTEALAAWNQGKPFGEASASMSRSAQRNYLKNHGSSFPSSLSQDSNNVFIGVTNVGDTYGSARRQSRQEAGGNYVHSYNNNASSCRASCDRTIADKNSAAYGSCVASCSN